ncbi:L-fuculokinase [Rhizobium leguminosarum]|uniref:FGGY-family carbohydrate kinase n=1 Tax=Rhizobium leguminosarum TaxID=384 RepID=UPI003F94BC1C
MSYILGVDLGTTAIKAAVFDADGHEKGSHTCEYTLLTPFSGAVELEATTYIQAFKHAVASAIDTAEVDKDEIVSLGISAQGETIFLLDEHRQPLRPAIVWMDTRAEEESNFIEEQLGRERIHKTTGQVGMNAIWPAAKILWIKRNEPEVFAKTSKFLLIEDFFVHLLTGKLVAEDSLLCSAMYWDINTRKYWPEMLDLLGISEAQLPEICHPGTPVATVSPSVAEEFGLSTKTLVCLGALDQACGAIGVGNVKPGIFSESTGAALASVAMTDHPVIDPSGQMPCFASGIPGMYMVHAYSTGGMAIRWFRDAFWMSELAAEREGGPNVYSLIDEAVKSTPPGCDGLRVLPHLQGSGPPDTNAQAKGIFLNVTLAHSRAHFARGLMEGVSMVLLRMIEGTRALGVDVREIRSLSGGAKSAAWCQLKANASGLPVRTMHTTDIAACLGAAILAGVAAGVWKSVVDTASSIAKYDLQYEPDAKHFGLYQDMLAEYKGFMKDLVPLTKKM